MDILKKQLEVNEALVTERYKTWVDMTNKYKTVNFITNMYEKDYLKAKKESEKITDKINELYQEQEQEQEQVEVEVEEAEVPSVQKRKNIDINTMPPKRQKFTFESAISEISEYSDNEEPIDVDKKDIDYEPSDELEEVEVEVSSEKKETKNSYRCPIIGCRRVYKCLGWLNNHYDIKHSTCPKPSWIRSCVKVPMSKPDSAFKCAQYDIMLNETPRISLREATEKIARRWQRRQAL
jgi:hypothetical protein